MTSAGPRATLLEDDRKGDLSQRERCSLIISCCLAFLILGPMTIGAPPAPSVTIAIQPFEDLDAGLLLEVRKGIEELFVQRVRRVVNHELGHTFGLLHCDHAGCLMRDVGGSIKTVDDGTGEFCARCAGRIRQALGRRG